MVGAAAATCKSSTVIAIPRETIYEYASARLGTKLVVVLSDVIVEFRWFGVAVFDISGPEHSEVQSQLHIGFQIPDTPPQSVACGTQQRIVDNCLHSSLPICAYTKKGNQLAVSVYALSRADFRPSFAQHEVNRHQGAGVPMVMVGEA